MIKYNEIYHSKYTQMIIFIWIHTLLTTRICLDAYSMSYSIKCRVKTDRSVVLKWIRHDKMKSQTIRVSRTIRVFIHIKTKKKQKTLGWNSPQEHLCLKMGFENKIFFFSTFYDLFRSRFVFFYLSWGYKKENRKELDLAVNRTWRFQEFLVMSWHDGSTSQVLKILTWNICQ